MPGMRWGNNRRTIIMAHHVFLFMQMSEDVHGSTGRRMNHTKGKVFQIQYDKLCEELGCPKGTKIDIKTIREITKLKIKDFIVINGKSISITPGIFAIATILLDKIEG